MLYEKLSPAAQERARDWYRTCLNDDQWWDSTYDEWKEKLRELGFADVDIRFSGFWSQGDGASFTSGVSREFKAPAEILTAITEATAVAKVARRFSGQPADVDLSYELSISIQRSTHERYVHPYTISAESTLSYGDDMPEALGKKLEAWAEGLRDSLTEETRDLSNQIYRALEAEWDDLNSDETVAANIIANEYHFDSEGGFSPRRRLAA